MGEYPWLIRFCSLPRPMAPCLLQLYAHGACHTQHAAGTGRLGVLGSGLARDMRGRSFSCAPVFHAPAAADFSPTSMARRSPSAHRRPSRLRFIGSRTPPPEEHPPQVYPGSSAGARSRMGPRVERSRPSRHAGEHQPRPLGAVRARSRPCPRARTDPQGWTAAAFRHCFQRPKSTSAPTQGLRRTRYRSSEYSYAISFCVLCRNTTGWCSVTGRGVGPARCAPRDGTTETEEPGFSVSA